MSYIEEKYIRATNSSHLQMTEFDGDPDVLMAMAGVDPSGLAAMLWRLRKEFDVTIRGCELQAANLPLARFMALDSRSVKQHLTPFVAAIRHFAIQRAKEMAPDLPIARVVAITGRVVDRLIDDRCSVCHGVGTLGAYGGPRPICHACEGSRNRRSQAFSTDLTEHDLGAWLMMKMEGKCEEVARQMSRALARYAEAAVITPTRLPAFGAGLPKPAPCGTVADLIATKAIAKASGFGELT